MQPFSSCEKEFTFDFGQHRVINFALLSRTGCKIEQELTSFLQKRRCINGPHYPLTEQVQTHTLLASSESQELFNIVQVTTESQESLVLEQIFSIPQWTTALERPELANLTVSSSGTMCRT